MLGWCVILLANKLTTLTTASRFYGTGGKIILAFLVGRARLSFLPDIEIVYFYEILHYFTMRAVFHRGLSRWCIKPHRDRMRLWGHNWPNVAANDSCIGGFGWYAVFLHL